jgi:hypothetical protein
MFSVLKGNVARLSILCLPFFVKASEEQKKKTKKKNKKSMSNG